MTGSQISAVDRNQAQSKYISIPSNTSLLDIAFGYSTMFDLRLRLFMKFFDCQIQMLHINIFISRSLGKEEFDDWGNNVNWTAKKILSSS